MRSILPVLLFSLSACSGGDVVVTPPGADDTDPATPGAGGALRAGDLVVSEFLLTSSSCPSTTGQYIEIHNPSILNRDLTGLLLSDGGSSWTLPALEVPPGGFVVGRPAGDCAGYADFRYEGLTLTTTAAGRVQLHDGTTLIDQVSIADWVDAPGQAWTLTAARMSATANDSSANWCAGVAAADPTTGDLGTPGAANPTCPPVLPDTRPRAVSELAPGSLVVTEVMLHPGTCAAPFGQYLEIFNGSTWTVDLSDLQLSDGSTTASAGAATTVGPGQLAWVGGGTFSDHCFLDAVLPDGTWGADLTFDLGETIYIGSGTPFVVMDEAHLDGLSQQSGVSLQLSDLRRAPTDNDVPANWCMSQSVIPTYADRGTPGTQNIACPVDGSAFLPLKGSDLLAGDLIISEVMFNPDGCPDFNAQYFEVFNNSGQDLDLQGLTIVTGVRSVTLTRNYPIDDGDWAIAEIIGGSGSVAACYTGLINDFGWDTGQLDDSGDIIELFSNIGLIDAINLVGESVEPGSALQLDPDFLSAQGNDAASHWCHSTQTFTGSQGDRGSPHQPNEQCAGIDDTGDTADAGPPPDPAVSVHDLSPGDLVITELLTDPVDCSDFSAEYLEIFNTTDQPVDLTGMQVGVGGAQGVIFGITGDLEPLSYATLRYSSTGSAPSCYTPDFIALYGAAKMDDSGTTVRLLNGAGLIDQVASTGWAAITAGAALQLDPDLVDATANDDAASWCPATTTFPGSTADLGSPGAENAQCPGAGGPTDSGDTFLPADTDPPVPTISIHDANPGDLIITEFMHAPDDCGDFGAEYVEVYNPTSSAIDLNGLIVQIGAASQTAIQSFDPVPPAGYGLLRYSTGSQPGCYGFTGNAWYSSDKMDDQGSLVRISNHAGTLDTVPATGWIGLVDGSAHQLDPAFMNPVSNDDPTYWCPSTSSFPGSVNDLGSPGQSNDPCSLDTGGAGGTGDTGAAAAAVVSTTAIPLDIEPQPGSFDLLTCIP